MLWRCHASDVLFNHVLSVKTSLDCLMHVVSCLCDIYDYLCMFTSTVHKLYGVSKARPFLKTLVVFLKTY